MTDLLQIVYRSFLSTFAFLLLFLSRSLLPLHPPPPRPAFCMARVHEASLRSLELCTTPVSPPPSSSFPRLGRNFFSLFRRCLFFFFCVSRRGLLLLLYRGGCGCEEKSWGGGREHRRKMAGPASLIDTLREKKRKAFSRQPGKSSLELSKERRRGRVLSLLSLSRSSSSSVTVTFFFFPFLKNNPTEILRQRLQAFCFSFSKKKVLLVSILIQSLALQRSLAPCVAFHLPDRELHTLQLQRERNRRTQIRFQLSALHVWRERKKRKKSIQPTRGRSSL